jgi:hypothetical protein
MDINVAEVPEEHKEKQVCFYCQKPGHIKKDCRKRLANEARGRKPQTQVQQVRDLLAVLINEHF